MLRDINYFIERHLVQSYREKGYLLCFKRFIDDIIGIWNGNLESLKCFLSEYDNLENGINITHVISFGRLSYLILGFLSVRNPHIVLNFPLTRNHLTSICISHSSLLIPTATRKLLLKVSLFVTAGVVQPLNLSMLRDINSGKDSDLENVLSSSCCLSSEVLHKLIVVHYLNRSA